MIINMETSRLTRFKRIVIFPCKIRGMVIFPGKIRAKHLNGLCGKLAGVWEVKRGGAYNNH
jgi:hypothetical protein